MKKRIALSIVVLLLAGLLIGCAEVPMAQMSQLKGGGETAILTPLPKNIKIIPPAADIPKEIAAFSGIWQGAWNESLPTALVAEEIIPPNVRGIYATGPVKETGKSGFDYFEGTISPGKLEIKISNVHIIYALTTVEGELMGTYKLFSSDGKTIRILRATLHKRGK